MNLRVAILDDEPLAIELLSDYVQRTEGLALVWAGTDPYVALRLVQAGGVDLMLLDVQMPELTGLQFLKIAGDGCRFILSTAYPDYALDGYEYNIVDYLLKPVSPERFAKAIAKVKTPATPAKASEPARPDHIFLKSEYKLVRIALNEILYVEALRDYVAVHTTGGGKLLSLEPMRRLEEVLPADRFVRIHKSYIIALDKIGHIERNFVALAGRELPIGSTYKEELLRRVSG
ncbi:LytTR family DNA-binding domain-containing protein [Flaviaesturariibacter amylovorans]|uniref:LytTR family DNA-binding domain-containing protein n=1 Tax=Flaviaesturariibacter amylovorans TaxID=1084520 RepID=A0ABP8HGC4_9BACT